MEDNKACETPLEDLRNSALAEYELASNAINSWNSFIINAIKNYDPKSNRLDSQLPKIAEAIKELEQLSKEMIDECSVDDDVSGGYILDPEGTWINKLYEVINKLDTNSNFPV